MFKYWDDDVDYQKEMDDAVARGDYEAAAIAEYKRNGKIKANGLDYETTNNYSSYLDFDPDMDYQAGINDAVGRGDYQTAGKLQKGRNKKLDALGMGGQKSYEWESYSPFEYEDFSYDPETDASYKAYTKQYTRNMQRATEDTLGKYAGMTGGMPSTAAMGAAVQAGAYEMSKLSDKIPELEQMAYQRWANERSQAFDEHRDTRNFAYTTMQDKKADDWEKQKYQDAGYWQQQAWDRDEARYQDDQTYKELNDQVARGMAMGNATGDYGGLPDEWYTPEAKQALHDAWEKSDHRNTFGDAVSLASGGVSYDSIVAKYPELTDEEKAVIKSVFDNSQRDLNSSRTSGTKTRSTTRTTTRRSGNTYTGEDDEDDEVENPKISNKTETNNKDEVVMMEVGGREYSSDEIEYYIGTGEMVWVYNDETDEYELKWIYDI